MKHIKPNKFVPILMLGVPGIGKTQIIEQSFDHVEKLLLSSCVEEDIAGIPYRDGQIARRTKPDWLARLEVASKNSSNKVCLFLDEIDKARRSVADTLLTLVSSRTVGEFKLPSDVCIVGAANPDHAGGGPEGLSQPMMNRFSIIKVEPDLGDWIKWASNKFKSSGARATIRLVANGVIPLYETHGEGMELRTTSPRSLVMALELFENGLLDDRMAHGLLTTGAASSMMLALNEQTHDVEETSSNIVRKASNFKKANVLRP